MLPLNARYYVLLGNYGSGKTELAIQLARLLRRQSRGRVALVDLDIVNPYFRSAEQKALLESEGVEVKMPSFALTAVDVPALPADIQAVFEQPYDHVVFDVGGDDVGAAALGRYAPYIAHVRSQMCVLYVVNPYRPLSSTPEDIERLFGLIAERARVRPDYLVNNMNLQGYTTAEDLVEGQRILETVSRALDVPVGLCVGEERLREGLPPSMQAMFLPLTPVMRPEWMEQEP